MFVHDRQERIPGWNQDCFRRASVAVVGCDWLGLLLVSGLASLGIGRILWIGPLCSATERASRWWKQNAELLGPGSRLQDFEFDIEYASDLDAALGNDAAKPALGVCTSGSLDVQRVCRQWLQERNIPFLAASSLGGGWIGDGELPPEFAGSSQQPIPSLLAAGVIADLIRERLCPLLDGSAALIGPIASPRMPAASQGRVLQVGVGGIGSYAALVLAAQGLDQHLIDGDRIEPSNLNRQGLYSTDDVYRGRFKAEAAAATLSEMFPRRRITHEIRRVDDLWVDDIFRGPEPPAVVVSAVDNAQTRLCLQRLRDAGVTVVQGGTDVFTAECFVQRPEGPTLDEQMHGALSTALSRENAAAHRGECAIHPSYVAPSMIAGAMVACRVVQVLAGGPEDATAPLRWRAGCLPCEHRRDVNEQHIRNVFAALAGA
jgi:molybdopterin/thiamine biosynthesis adenylyltransferase